MNSIRPLISYSELLAAQTLNNMLLEDLRNDKIIQEIKKPRRHKEILELDNNINFCLEVRNNINKVFVNQVTQIEFQIDINYPQL